jgi:hypothetical protein
LGIGLGMGIPKCLGILSWVWVGCGYPNCWVMGIGWVYGYLKCWVSQPIPKIPTHTQPIPNIPKNLGTPIPYPTQNPKSMGVSVCLRPGKHKNLKLNRELSCRFRVPIVKPYVLLLFIAIKLSFEEKTSLKT